MYHKYIFLNVNSIYDLVQTLLFEELYVENEQLSPEREQEEQRKQEQEEQRKQELEEQRKQEQRERER